MAFVKTPSTVIANWSEDATNITVPLASFPELTAAEADASTGDIRKIVYAIMEKLFSWYNALATADRPSRLTIYRSSSMNESTGELTRVYSVQVTCEIASSEVKDEPA